MNRKEWNYFLVSIFLLLTVAIIVASNSYKQHQNDEYSQKLFSELSLSVTKKIDTLIEEKKNATLTIAIALSRSEKLHNALLRHDEIQTVLHDFSDQLAHETDFKNVWIQLVNSDGISIARSWTDKAGGDLSKIRSDIRLMKFFPKTQVSVSVGQFDMTFKGMVPLYDDSGNYIGCLEVITHFNSIAEKLKEDNYNPIVLVDKRYHKQLIYPFTKLFAGEYYVANGGVDPNLLRYVRDKGAEKVIDLSRSYYVDDTQTYLILRYTIYDIDNEPMANILLFKPTHSLSKAAMDTMVTNVNLYTLFIVLIVGFLLFLLSKRDKTEVQSTRSNRRYILISLFLFSTISILYYVLIEHNRMKAQKAFLVNYNENVEHDYTILYNSLSTIADLVYKMTLEKKEVVSAMEMAYKGDVSKEKGRKHLWTVLQNDYHVMGKFQFRQLHFHLKNNESYLRFHRPNKFGDNLTGIRNTVEWVNTHHASINGFEEGRIYNGFRNVYPIHNTQEHLGSVEISFSSLAFINEFIKQHNTKAGFLIISDTVDEKVFKEEQRNYYTSPLKGFYYEKQINAKLSQENHLVDLSRIDPHMIAMVEKNIFKGEIFSLPSTDGAMLFSFIPLKNPVTQKVVATIVIEKSNNFLVHQNRDFFFYLTIGVFAILLLTLLFYREITSRVKFQTLSSQTQRILDTQQAIVIITDGVILENVNHAFLRFFNYPSLENFLESYQCICDLFVVDKNYFHLGKLKKDQIWIDALITLPQKERIVLIRSNNGIEHSFSVDLNRFRDNDFVVTFTDISETMLEQHALFDKATHDHLTGLYNREFFETNIQQFIRYGQKTDKLFGLMMLDIDHFKNVNDTYGHSCGDEALYDFARLIHASIRNEDYAIRWGGEEFIVLVYVSSLDEVERISENLRSKVKEHIFKEIGTLTCSIGYTLYNQGETIIETINRADKALYKAKEFGRNRVIGL